MENISSDIKRFLNNILHSFKNKDIVIRLIYINVGIFLVFAILGKLLELFNIYSFFMLYFELPSSIGLFITRPWSLITYMFLHDGIMHILFNMLWLYWFGRLFLMYFNPKQFTALYFMGGIAGGLLYIIAYNVFPFFALRAQGSFLVGASAAVLAIVVGLSAYIPNYKLRLLLFGEVSLKAIAIVTVILDLLSITSENAGGHWAHLGGIILGFFFGFYMRMGRDITRPLVSMGDYIGSLFKTTGKRKSKMKVTYQDVHRESDGDYNARKHRENEEIDQILDKIKRSGYGSLSAEEKKKLFDASNK